MLLSIILAATMPSVTVKSVLHEMVNFDRLAYPLPYTHAQASSYDRKSDPGPHSDPFANADFGNFLRLEPKSGRIEYVMADLKGPGLVDRLWSANPVGVIRFYFDGEPLPRFQADMNALLSGQVTPFGKPFGYDASHGKNLYFPFPYAKSLKITVDDSTKDKPTGLYYHVGYRTYKPGTEVETFKTEDLPDALAEMSKTAVRLETDEQPAGEKVKALSTVFPAGKTTSVFRIQSAGVVRLLKVKIPFPSLAEEKAMPWTDPRQDHNMLRQLLLQVRVDGHLCVSTPLGDFFGSAPGINPYRTIAASMAADGTLVFRLPMPFANHFDVQVQNLGPFNVPVEAEVTVDRSLPANFPPFRLHAQWTAERGQSRPFKDMNLLTAKGSGNWVGCNLAVANPSGAWWGEGDEKVYVDGESFPSTFGTGTEDFFGYAWSSPALFQKPYHAQSRVDGPGVMGHTSVVRWQLFDPIPYTQSLKFDLERWHWADVIATYGRTAYWYAPADSSPPATIDKSLLLPEEIKSPKVPGAIEGETLRIALKTGGVTQIQEGFGEFSNGAQLWWREAKVGDKISLKVPVSQQGRYEVIAVMGNAVDYGIFQIQFNGSDCGRHDFYLEGLAWRPISLGVYKLSAGESTLNITCCGHNSLAVPANMFGLDYLLLKRLP
jgi:hypothetical protein